MALGTLSYKALYYMRHDDADVNVSMVMLRDWPRLFKVREIDILSLSRPVSDYTCHHNVFGKTISILQTFFFKGTGLVFAGGSKCSCLK